MSTKAVAGAKTIGNFLFSAVNKAGETVSKAGAKIKKTVEENVSFNYRQGVPALRYYSGSERVRWFIMDSWQISRSGSWAFRWYCLGIDASSHTYGFHKIALGNFIFLYWRKRSLKHLLKSRLLRNSHPGCIKIPINYFYEPFKPWVVFLLAWLFLLLRGVNFFFEGQLRSKLGQDGVTEVAATAGT